MQTGPKETLRVVGAATREKSADKAPADVCLLRRLARAHIQDEAPAEEDSHFM